MYKSLNKMSERIIEKSKIVNRSFRIIHRENIEFHNCSSRKGRISLILVLAIEDKGNIVRRAYLDSVSLILVKALYRMILFSIVFTI